jgi:hypothetical protein
MACATQSEEPVILRLFARVMLAMLLALTPAPLFYLRTTSEFNLRANPTIRPEFATQIQSLRPTILMAAKRHNRPELSHMSDQEFAVVLSQILYNEHFGWLEEAIPIVQPITPFYQGAQVVINESGSDFTVWPSNLRPSVGVELLRGELPIPGGIIHVPVSITGTHIHPQQFRDQPSLYTAVNAEIAQPDLAIEYLAANLERGLYRAHYERVPVTWQTLAAWHNQGIVAPADIQANPTAIQYLQRAASYRQAAAQLVQGVIKVT